MAFNPTIRTERTVVGEDRTWCATRSGWDTCRSITLDVSTFTEAENVDGKVIYSGIALAELPSGLYGPYDPDAVDSQNTGTGLLFSSLQLDDEDVSVASNVAAAMLWEGVVTLSNFKNFGAAEGMIDAAFQTDVPTIRYEP